VPGLVGEPCHDMAGECELAERLAEALGQGSSERLGVEAGGLLGLEGALGTPLHEQALARVERRQLVVPGRQAGRFGADAEELGQEILEMRREIDTPASILRSATGINAELLMEKGRLGAIAEGAYADLLIVEGNPLADLGVLMNPQKNLKLIMKDGTIYKNELAA